MITVVVGPPCGGKSTYVMDRAALQDVVVDYDKLAVALGSPTSHHTPRDIGQVAFAARASAISRILRGVAVDAWIIHTSPSTDQMKTYAGRGAEFVILDPGVDECLARAEGDGRTSRTIDGIRSWYRKRPVVPESRASATDAMSCSSVPVGITVRGW